ncbi:MAG: phosphate propanoyltransferase [Patescibacteria group bacterium]
MAVEFPLSISARHLHLSEEHLKTLFGPGHRLHPVKPLSQPGQFSSEETVSVSGPKGTFPKVRVLGPTRRQTQVEISRSDAFVLGVDPPVRDSGDLSGSPGVRLAGPCGEVELTEGCIVAQRHLHLQSAEAGELGLKDRDHISVRVGGTGSRALVLEHVLVRVADNFAMDLHLDTDEANAAGIHNGDRGVWIRGGGQQG